MTAGFETVDGVEVWVETDGRPGSDVAQSVGSAAAAGIDHHRIFLIIGPSGTPEAIEARALVDSLGLGELSADVTALDDRIAATTADTIVLVRSGRLSTPACGLIVEFFERYPQVGLVYGDSNDAGGRDALRPAFSPLRLRGGDYLGPVIGLRTEAVRARGSSDAPSTDAFGFALALRGELSPALLPAILATSDAMPVHGADDAAILVQQSIPTAATIEPLAPGLRRVHYPVEGEPLVSIVIPTRGGSAEIAGTDRVLVVEAVRGIVESSTYRNVEFVIVADSDTPQSVLDDLAALCGDRLTVVGWFEEFNFSAKMNRGAAVARGEYLLLLNDDVELIATDWIETMLGLAQQPGVGIVGAQLYFEDSTLQHAGQVYSGGVAGHAAFGWAGGRDDSLRSLAVDREVSGVTAACALLRRDVYFEVGGFTLALPGNYNDVDLNMKIRATGRTAVFSPWVRLYHFESKSRDPRILPSDLETLQSRWSRRMQVEMYSRML